MLNKSPIAPVSFAHISIVVNDIDSATSLYRKIFNAVPIQHIPHSKDAFWAKNLGLSKNPKDVDVSIRFILIPIVNLYIELLQYHNPTAITEKKKLNIGVGHISLTINNIDQAFQYIKEQDELTICCTLKDYKPLRVKSITEDDFYFFDEDLESSKLEKSKTASLINSIRFFTFNDPYNVTWELAESDEIYKCSYL